MWKAKIKAICGSFSSLSLNTNQGLRSELRFYRKKERILLFIISLYFCGFEHRCPRSYSRGSTFASVSPSLLTKCKDFLSYPKPYPVILAFCQCIMLPPLAHSKRLPQPVVAPRGITAWSARPTKWGLSWRWITHACNCIIQPSRSCLKACLWTTFPLVPPLSWPFVPQAARYQNPAPWQQSSS